MTKIKTLPIEKYRSLPRSSKLRVLVAESCYINCTGLPHICGDSKTVPESCRTIYKWF
jgi:hypothetical protein